MKIINSVVFIDYELDVYAIPIPLTNFSALCAGKNLEENLGGGLNELDFTLTRKPKSDVYLK